MVARGACRGVALLPRRGWAMRPCVQMGGLLPPPPLTFGTCLQRSSLIGRHFFHSFQRTWNETSGEV